MLSLSNQSMQQLAKNFKQAKQAAKLSLSLGIVFQDKTLVRDAKKQAKKAKVYLQEFNKRYQRVI